MPPKKRARTGHHCFRRAEYKRTSALLNLAALDHDETAARELLRVCPDSVDRAYSPGEGGHQERALHVACGVGAAGVVRLLLAGGADAGAPKGNGATPLCIAAEFGHDDIIRQLLSAGARVDGFVRLLDGAVMWPLRFAANWGRCSAAQLLLDAQADPNITVSEACPGSPRNTISALLMACIPRGGCGQGHLEVAELLLRRGADPWLGTVSGGHCLHVTSSRGELGLLDALLRQPRQSRLDIDRRIDESAAGSATPDTVGATALYLACQRGHVAVVERLLAHGANPSAPNWRGDAPITVATLRSHTDVVRVLIRAKADLEAAPTARPPQPAGPSLNEDEHWVGKTALCVAATRDGNTAIARLLIDAGANLEATDCCGDSPLQTAVYFGQLEMTRQLLRAGANLSQRNKQGDTAVHTACHRGNSRVLRLLLGHGADPSLRTCDPWAGRFHLGIGQYWLIFTYITPVLVKKYWGWKGPGREMLERLQMTPLHTAFVAAPAGLLGVVHELVAGGAVWQSPLPADVSVAQASQDPSSRPDHDVCRSMNLPMWCSCVSQYGGGEAFKLLSPPRLSGGVQVDIERELLRRYHTEPDIARIANHIK
jgi:ankyrin repeat protein